MQLTAVLAALALPLLAHAASASISYDQTYDNGSQSTLALACSDGANGLAAEFPTLGAFPGFPRVGAASAVAGWNSASCGKCFRLAYGRQSLYFTAADHAGAVGGTESAFVVSLAALNKLTNGQGAAVGRVTGTAQEVASSFCGL